MNKIWINEFKNNERMAERNCEEIKFIEPNNLSLNISPLTSLHEVLETKGLFAVDLGSSQARSSKLSSRESAHCWHR